jgi:ParB family transcriptional regulator, chromosome partitioning protein
VRAAAHLDRQFLASLREHGVMNAIHVARADDGTLTVKRGQRRTVGAVKIGLTTVPVLVVADDTDEADRIVKQWHENERRDALTETDRLAAVEQLTILGVPAGNIARWLGTPKNQVEAAVQSSGSDLAKTAARRHALTLTDTALIAEFEDDDKTVAAILRAVKDGDSAEHVAQRAGDEKARQEAEEAAVAALVDAGVTVIDRPGYDDKTVKELRDIRLLNATATPRSTRPPRPSTPPSPATPPTSPPTTADPRTSPTCAPTPRPTATPCTHGTARPACPASSPAVG